jgi:hypothetical protein
MEEKIMDPLDQIRDICDEHPHFGPIVLTAGGDCADKQPGEGSPFWTAVDLLARQGGAIDSDGLCVWAPELEPELVHLGGRNYALAGSALAKKYKRTTP